MIKAVNIRKTFANRSSSLEKIVLNDVSINVEENEIVGLMGQSGCGKSTLARILLRLIDPDEGQVYWDNIDVSKVNGKKLRKMRSKIQFIAQRPESFFDPSYKLKNSLIEAVKNLNLYKKNEYEQELEKLLHKVKLDNSVIERYPHQVSGGEIQRVSICRALLLKPKCIILDEPTSMLDIFSQAQVLNILKQLQKEEKLSYLFISHNKDVIKFMCNRVIELKKGKIV